GSSLRRTRTQKRECRHNCVRRITSIMIGPPTTFENPARSSNGALTPVRDLAQPGLNMSEWLNNRVVIYSPEQHHDRKTDARAHRRERPRESPSLLHGGARVGEARVLPASRQSPLGHRRTQGAGP